MRVTQAIERNLQIQPDNIATVYGERQRSWREFGGRIAQLAGGLQKLQLKIGDAVAIVSLNSDYYLEVMFATPWSGGVIVPINTRWSPAEIAYALNDSNARYLFLDENFVHLATTLEPLLDTAISMIYCGDSVPEGFVTSIEALVDDNQPVSAHPHRSADLSGIFYTGGTTGRSKGVMLSHENHVTNTLQLAAISGIPVDHSYLHAAPMFHIADALFIYLTTALGGRHVIVPRFEPASCAQALQDHAITDIILVPTMIQMLLALPDLDRYDLHHLKRLFFGAAPMPAAVLRRLIESLPDCAPMQLYGQTEAAPLITGLQGKYHTLEHLETGLAGSAGQAMPCVEIRIVDENDNEVPRGTVGEIIARGPNIMLGYWRLEEQTAAALRDGWLYTGDAAYMNDNGFIFISDRLKDMIISGGENVYSTEVENALHQHSAVDQCAVIGIPDDKWGERVHAIVVLKEGENTSESELISHCRAWIADYKCPRSIAYQKEALPLSGAGKILKTELRKPYWKNESKQVN